MQKTAYDMRISDWSSDVCSSDLDPSGGVRLSPALRVGDDHWPRPSCPPTTAMESSRSMASPNRCQSNCSAQPRTDSRTNPTLSVRSTASAKPTSSPGCTNTPEVDRKSVVWGKSVSVRVDLGGRSISKKKKKKN